MASACGLTANTNDDFQVVRNKKGRRKQKQLTCLPGTFLDSNDDTEVDINSFRKRISNCQDEIQLSGFYSSLLETLEKAVGSAKESVEGLASRLSASSAGSTHHTGTGPSKDVRDTDSADKTQPQRAETSITGVGEGSGSTHHTGTGPSKDICDSDSADKTQLQRTETSRTNAGGCIDTRSSGENMVDIKSTLTGPETTRVTNSSSDVQIGGRNASLQPQARKDTASSNYEKELDKQIGERTTVTQRVTHSCDSTNHHRSSGATDNLAGERTTDPQTETNCNHEKSHHGLSDITEALPMNNPGVDKVQGLGRDTGRLSMLVYGLGNFASCVIARYQLALVLALRQHFKIATAQCEAYDPRFSVTEKKILADLGCSVIQHNEEGKRRMARPTLVVMPHCGRALFNNLLWANWSPAQLQRLVVMGNSFSNMLDSIPQRECTDHIKYVATISPQTREKPVVNSFLHTDIFNDMSVHWFPPTQLLQLPPDTWTHPAEPLYPSQDLEIILKSKT